MADTTSYLDTDIAVDALSDTDGTPATVAGRSLLVFRVGDDVYATQRACLHQGGDLGGGIVVDGQVICPLHGWRFDVRSGLHADSPYNCLQTFAAEVRNGRVFVDPTPRPRPLLPEP